MKWTLTEMMLLRDCCNGTLHAIKVDMMQDMPVFYREDIHTRLETIAAVIRGLETEKQMLKNKLKDETNNP